MQSVTVKPKQNKTLDLIKILCAVFIVATHLPSFFQSEPAYLYFKQWFVRFCVPFFFICSGYFFYKSSHKENNLKRVFWLFAFSFVLYFPEMLGGVQSWEEAFSVIRWNAVFGYGHLWYLSAALEGLLVWYVLEKIPVISKLFQKLALPAAVVLLIAGAVLDEYFYLFQDGPIRKLGEFLLIFGGPRNVVFMGFPLLIIGGACARYEARLRRIPGKIWILCWVLLRLVAFLECRFLLDRVGTGITTDISFFGWMPAVAAFALSFHVQVPVSDKVSLLMRKLSEYIYVLHPMVSALLPGFLNLTPFLHYAVTIAMCSVLYILLEKQFVPAGRKQ